MGTELATTQPQSPSLAVVLQAIVDGGVTPDNIGTLERMMALQERVEAKNAEKDFNSSLASFQAEMPELVAQSVIPQRGKYERYEDILHVARPLLSKHGFSVNFTQSASDGRIGVTCSLRHRAGHSTETPFFVRPGGRADSDTQVDCKASTTAKRNAFCLALNIIIRQNEIEEDASLLGAPVDLMGAEILEKRAKEVNANIPAFLSIFGVDKFSDFPANRLGEAHDRLDAKERKNKEAR